LLAALYDRAQLPPLDRSFLGMALVAVAGGSIGAALLVLTPERMFTALVPLLLGFATILFAFAGQISTWLRERAAASGGGDERRSLHSLAALLPVCVYGGYFGAGVGVLLIAALSVANGGDYRAANVTKNFVGSLNNLVAATVFATQGTIAWIPALLVALGAIGGALAGAHVARILPVAAARGLVIGFGALLTAVYAWRYWL
jgi:uncharacterized membrane protein YfcA